MIFERSSGVLLHPSSLPGRFGIGDLGEAAYKFVDFLAEAGQTLWQILPLGPTSYGDSPYQAVSTFAGNTNLISLEKLVEDGYLRENDLADAPDFPHHIDYGTVIGYHDAKLAIAFQNFKANPGRAERGYRAWVKKNAYWLDDFAVFMALKNAHDGKTWTSWEEGFALHQPDAIAWAQTEFAETIALQRFRQWTFFKQWSDVKTYANTLGIRLIGDAPIFVAHDSSDVWGDSEQFYLDEKGNPTVVAGVPPDYFSETGQRWGNPLYRWDVMRKDGYAWWAKRLRAIFETVDILRIDHFRGFEAFWEVPASEPTAMIGRWVKGPADHLFVQLRKTLGDLPIIAEDLGVITPEVEDMRDNAGFPGMKVLQFAWGGKPGVNGFQPHHHVTNSVVYTGTHDNNTTVGWWASGEADAGQKENFTRYVGHQVTNDTVHWEMMRLALGSVGHTCVIPIQDVLGVGEEGRQNVPGQAGGNWGWRMTDAQLASLPTARLRALTEIYGRLPGTVKA